MSDKVKVRTTFFPDVELEVDPYEAEYFKFAGLLVGEQSEPAEDSPKP